MCLACEILKTTPLRNLPGEPVALFLVSGQPTLIAKEHTDISREVVEDCLALLRDYGISYYGNHFTLDTYSQPYPGHWSATAVQLHRIRKYSEKEGPLRCVQCGAVLSLEEGVKVSDGSVIIVCPRGCKHKVNIDTAVVRCTMVE